MTADLVNQLRLTLLSKGGIPRLAGFQCAVHLAQLPMEDIFSMLETFVPRLRSSRRYRKPRVSKVSRFLPYERIHVGHERFRLLSM